MQKTRFPPHHHFPNHGVAAKRAGCRTHSHDSLSAHVELRRVRRESHTRPILSPRRAFRERRRRRRTILGGRTIVEEEETAALFRCIVGLSMTFRAARLEMREVYIRFKNTVSSFSSQSRDKKGSNILSRYIRGAFFFSLSRVCACACVCVCVLCVKLCGKSSFFPVISRALSLVSLSSFCLRREMQFTTTSRSLAFLPSPTAKASSRVTKALLSSKQYRRKRRLNHHRVTEVKMSTTSSEMISVQQLLTDCIESCFLGCVQIREVRARGISSVKSKIEGDARSALTEARAIEEDVLELNVVEEDGKDATPTEREMCESLRKRRRVREGGGRNVRRWWFSSGPSLDGRGACRSVGGQGVREGVENQCLIFREWTRRGRGDWVAVQKARKGLRR